MNYKKLYENLIKSAQNNPKEDSYKELHHIVPECVGGTNDLNNKVLLTARQHYLAHWLLYKIYKNSSLVHAWHCMSRIGKGQKERNVNSHLFQYCKKERNKLLSIKYSGEGNNFYGKKHSEDTRKLLSEINIGIDRRSEENIKKWINNVAKKKKTEEHKKKIGRKGLVMIQNINTLEILRVNKEDLGIIYDVNIWVNPRKISPEKKYKCEYCNIITTKSNLKRWHNDNCKFKVKHEN